ncbi:MAG: 30S ribosomal protein S13 [Candidatus Doudnabacteria bacterium RIFCSPLOWO2_02_FULL_49_13]|uniref:Small ribosomal subunit protein uS13 n=1 Tax=Candidatus Doudnabacteria bacterium RIFCSPHIGHO2_12_FULL_48_16 TaxID=1817838 RepID=A0A1F5PJD3_9BACT|nr:MAG: 30S ribosomal protein S13 [Candidatus Doudnabacteria bacterium RIFCSPHIGHO2_02_FULL_49_24]OGE89531.1 MAG: 30S ribosomal protein S13 [Candidatus Doudnabacteria bacterium RIFCSPHIGHO2_01_FULL_50_67]OGE89782.1 MAG: 30S ribosomal protein S13 [Candidatus Doudnabacteria bacterium RIFCSPHIGHO2_12_FULL_48_16]OGE97686.1 MAG: 30S ribosomal protein S13 [Candidatus Doudnabacteria bacterium RIFCSPLOWO2_01_FULL_49_40]OGF02785.1 MAG: 30S ribosomal protein S13 [Candidatus Doudnabacteria bacterium RIFCS
MALVRIAGVTLPQQKRIEAALPYIFGVGWSGSKRILAATKIDPGKRTSELSESEVAKIREFIEKNYMVEGALKQQIAGNIKIKKEIGSYQGIRHMRGLPVRGQRTKTNSRTRRGNVRKTAGSGRKNANEKT